jgi:hypothetical protein
MLEALAGGQRDPAALADLARRRLRSKIPELREALTGRFTQRHAFLTRVHLDLTGHRTRAIDDVTARIEVVIGPFQGIRDLIITIPGISTGVADVIIAETGADMTRFPTAGHLASRAGTCPGGNESAGLAKSTSTRPGNPYLKGAPGGPQGGETTCRSFPYRRWPASRRSAHGPRAVAAPHRHRRSPTSTPPDRHRPDRGRRSRRARESRRGERLCPGRARAAVCRRELLGGAAG